MGHMPHHENGVLRIVGHPKYPNSAGSPAVVASIMMRLRDLRGHVFREDGLSLVGSNRVDVAQITTPAHVADTYLLALAIARGGQLATFDRRLSAKAVRGGKAGLRVIDGAG